MNQIPLWMSETLENFIAHLSLSKSSVTVDAYKHDVTRFLEYLVEKAIKKLSYLKSDHIISYLGYCKSVGKSDASINRYYMAISSYCRFLRKIKAIQTDLTQDLTAPKNHQIAPRIPTIAEIERIMEQPNVNTESGLRDRAILEILYSSGLRATELCELELSDIQPTQVLVRCGKRSKTRSVPITSQAYFWISQYVERYRGKESGYLFLTQMGKRMRRQLLCVIVVEYAKKAKVDCVTTHTLRHACATHLLDGGADLRMIQEVLGHSSIASTQRYTHLSSNKIQSMFKQFHPRRTEVQCA